MNSPKAVFAILAFAAMPLLAQAPAESVPPVQTEAVAEVELAPVAVTPGSPAVGANRVFGVLPNYRTVDISQLGSVLSARRKFHIARKDSFDYPLVMLSAAFAGLGQLSNSAPSFGQGAKGYVHRLATNYADQAMGNMFTEGLFPAMLHQDPRYFRLGTGSTRHRIGYAASRVFVTHKDGGGAQFNYSEWLGNGSAVAISNAYYPDGRKFSNNATKLLGQVGTDALSQVLKEFWPDIKKRVFHK